MTRGAIMNERPPRTVFVEQMLALLPANDTGDQVRVRLATATPEDVERLLALAGYTADGVPLDQRLAALHLVWCLEKGVFDKNEIARFVGRGRAYARAIRAHIREAKK